MDTQMKAQSALQRVSPVILYAALPAFSCVLAGLSVPDIALPFGLVFAIFFTYSEIGILILGVLAAQAPAHASGIGTLHDPDPRSELALRASIFPSFAVMLALTDGYNRAFTLFSCLLAIFLVPVAQSIRDLFAKKLARFAMKGFAGRLVFAVFTSGAGLVLGFLNPFLASVSLLVLFLFLSAFRSRSSRGDGSIPRSGSRKSGRAEGRSPQ